MTSCYRRITIGHTALNIPVKRQKSRYPVEIPVFPPRSYNNKLSFGIALRQRNCGSAEAVRSEGRSEGEADADKVGPGRYFYSVEDQTVEVEKGERNRAVEVGVAAAMTVVFGVGNRVLYKLALVPLKRYPFFLAQLATFGNSIWGIYYNFFSAGGVIITVASGSSYGNSLKEAGIFWSLLMIVSFLLQAAGTVLKEVIFLDGAQRLKGGSVDLFVVNSYGSAFQALFIGLLLPFLPKLWGIPFSQLANYLKDGAACFLNIGGTLSSGCNGAPLLPLLFVIVNIGFNISLLHLLKISSAVVSSLASTFSVPTSVYIFTLPLPYLGVASPLPTGFVAGAIVLVTGLLIYAWSPSSSSSALPSPPT